MDASAALSELVELSTQVVEVVIGGPDGSVTAARTSGDARSLALAAVGGELVQAASGLRAAGEVERVHVDTERGAVVVVRDGASTITATTVPEPTLGLVAYDLRTALRRARGEAS